MWRAEMPNASTSSSGLPECGIWVTAIILYFAGEAPTSSQRLQHRFTQTAFRPVIFRSHQTPTRRADLGRERLAVQRLHAVEVNHANRNCPPLSTGPRL